MNLDKFRGSRAGLPPPPTPKPLTPNAVPVPMFSEVLGAVTDLRLNFMAGDPL